MQTEVETRIYRFRNFSLDLGAYQLYLNGEPVRLERRPLELLVFMVSRHGLLVTREEIIKRLWPGNVVIDFDTGLNTLVRKVRLALGDSPEKPQFIETVAGLGYRFIAPIAEAPNPQPPNVQPALPRPAPAYRTRAIMLATLAVAAVGAALLWYAGSAGTMDTRIAVLPFENLTGDDGLSYLASGLAEETSTSLAQIDLPDLAVIGGVSARALADSAMSIKDIGREFDVDFIVQSSLRLDQTRIRVTSRLIRIRDSEQIWTASFDRELTNVLGLQRELSVAIAEQIRQRLSPDVAAIIDRRQTQNPEAYELYLKGRYEWSRFLPTSIPQALQYYQQAVARDPRYALAWAGIAHALITSPVTAGARSESILPAAQDALQRALEYGPDLAETQLALGSFHFFLDWDFPPAEAAARRAVALDPNSAMAHMFLGMVLARRDKHIEARAMLRRARELDPLFPLMFANSANAAITAGDFAAAIELATQAIAINPEFWVGYLHLANAQLELGDYEAGLQSISAVERLSGRNAAGDDVLRAYALAKLGRENEVREILADLLSREADEYVSPYAIAGVYAVLGEPDPAFDWLERALAEHHIGLLGLPNSLPLRSLQADPRFASLMQRCGFVAESGQTL